jgi:hypothetical protein
MNLISTLDDFRNQTGSCVERNSGLGIVENLTSPPINGPDRRDVLPAGREAIKHKLPRESS